MENEVTRWLANPFAHIGGMAALRMKGQTKYRPIVLLVYLLGT